MATNASGQANQGNPLPRVTIAVTLHKATVSQIARGHAGPTLALDETLLHHPVIVSHIREVFPAAVGHKVTRLLFGTVSIAMIALAVAAEIQEYSEGGVMWQCVRAFLVCIAVVPIVSGSQAAGTILLSEKIAGQLPIADLHLHPHPGLSASDAKAQMDRNGVRWAGAGARQGGSYIWQEYKSELGKRFIAFAGQTELNRVFFSGGIAAMESASSFGIRSLLSDAEGEFKAGQIKGIGEIFINNSRSSRFPKFRRKGRTDAPSMRMLYKLVAKYDGFLTLHMHTDSDSVAGLERLLKSDRRGRILLNHCGVDSSASDIRPLLQRHPNLFCELSFRYPPVTPSRLSHRNVFGRSGPISSWLKLIEAFPDRFMIGTDAHNGSQYDGAIAMVRRGLLPYLRPATARLVAYGNAQRLFGLR